MALDKLKDKFDDGECEMPYLEVDPARKEEFIIPDENVLRLFRESNGLDHHLTIRVYIQITPNPTNSENSND